MRRWLFRALLAFILPFALLYSADYVALRVPLPKSRAPFGTVTVSSEYVIHEKNGKIEYQFAQPVGQTCVNSIFPHF